MIIGTGIFLSIFPIIKAFVLEDLHGTESVLRVSKIDQVSIIPQTVYWIFRILIEQCEGEMPRTSSTSLKTNLAGICKILLGFWLLMGLIITNGTNSKKCDMDSHGFIYLFYHFS